ncbi:PadR family transcriptional regulator [Anaerovorax sp. IOR16]|uniref:PadR family transcriptional regulator n=1 Tax=Anaerovorax sp. IOR16 TaxID=2773458 RepID=UPI0019D2FA35
MAREQLKTLTEPMYYVLLALTKERHGYGIMQSITELTEGRVSVGAGTLYALLSRFEKEGIVAQTREVERRKMYCLTELGEEVLTREYTRLNQLLKDGRFFFNKDGTLPPIDRDGMKIKEETDRATETDKQVMEGIPELPEEKQKKISSAPKRKSFRNALGKGLLTT